MRQRLSRRRRRRCQREDFFLKGFSPLSRSSIGIDDNSRIRWSPLFRLILRGCMCVCACMRVIEVEAEIIVKQPMQ